LQLLLDFLRPGDILTVTQIDRLARSIKDLQDIVFTLNLKGATLKATEQPIDTRTAAGKAFLDMLGVFAEFETNLRRKRQLEGSAAAKARGVYRGHNPSIVPAEVHHLYVDEKMGATAIARKLGLVGHRSAGVRLSLRIRCCYCCSGLIVCLRKALNGPPRLRLSPTCTAFQPPRCTGLSGVT
jgi:DNA invertase Pin-like site-specific DNA recombinase